MTRTHNDRNLSVFQAYLRGLSYEAIAQENNISIESARKIVTFYIHVINYNGEEFQSQPLNMRKLKTFDSAYLIKIITEYFTYGHGFGKQSWLGPLSTRAQKAIVRHSKISSKAELKNALLSGEIQIGTNGGIPDMGEKTYYEMMQFVGL